MPSQKCSTSVGASLLHHVRQACSPGGCQHNSHNRHTRQVCLLLACMPTLACCCWLYTHRGTLQECLDNFSPGGAWQHQVKGEIVLLVEGATAVQSDLQLATLLDAGPAPPGSPGTGMETLLGATGPAPASSPAAFRQQLTDAARMHLLAGASVADVTARLMSATGLKRNKVYSLVLQVRQKLVAEGQLSSA